MKNTVRPQRPLIILRRLVNLAGVFCIAMGSVYVAQVVLAHMSLVPERIMSVGHGIVQVLYAPDGKTVAYGTSDYDPKRPNYPYQFGTISVVRASNLQSTITQPLEMGGPAYVQYEDSGKSLYSIEAFTKKIYKINLQSHVITSTEFKLPRSVDGMQLSPDGKTVLFEDWVSSGRFKSIFRVRLRKADGQIITIAQCPAPIMGFSLSPNNQFVAVTLSRMGGEWFPGHPFSDVIVYDINARRIIQRYSVDDTNTLLKFSRDSSLLYGYSNSTHKALLWSLSASNPLWMTNLPGDAAILGFSISPNARMMAFAGYIDVVFLRADNGHLVLHCRDGSFPRYQWATDQTCSFSPDGKTLVSQGNQCIKFWRVPSL